MIPSTILVYPDSSRGTSGVVKPFFHVKIKILPIKLTIKRSYRQIIGTSDEHDTISVAISENIPVRVWR